MAGTISLSLSQQLDKYAKPLSGGKLYFYQANTVATPQNAYQDTALTLPLPNPIILDDAGRIPQFFLADGSIKIRLTDSVGDVQVSADGILVIGASSGGGGGPSVDPTTIFATGDVKPRLSSDIISGWVRINGRTIGSATSGATERANADVSALYAYIWNSFSDSICPVLSGRGANAAADFAANKQITLFDLRGRSLTGFDDMGNTSAGRLSAALFGTGNGTTVGSSGGEGAHTLTAGESAVLTLTSTVDEHGGHDHKVSDLYPGAGGTPFQAGAGIIGGAPRTSKDLTGITVATTSNAGGGAHNNMPPFAVTNWFWKL